MPVDIFAVATRGLEAVCAEEMSQLPGLQVKDTAYRRVTAVLRGDLSSVLALRTVDDVFVDAAVWKAVGPHRAALQLLRDNSRALDLRGVAAIVRQVRPVSRQPAFSVTANFVGRRNYSTDEIKAAVAEGVSGRYGWGAAEEDQSELNLRVFIEHDTAYVGVRIGETALHRRPWKRAHLPGSLKPSAAAAMLRLAQLSPGQRLLDPCCGAGTILIEGALQGAQTVGGDQDPQALQAARLNAASAGAHLNLHRWDAARLPLADQTVNCIVTNLPWGRQVQADENLARFYRAACGAFRQALAPGGRIVLLTSLPDWVRLEGWAPQAVIEISLFGQTPSVLVFQA